MHRQKLNKRKMLKRNQTKVRKMELEFLILSPLFWMIYNDARFDWKRYFLNRILFVNFNLNWSKPYGGYSLLCKSNGHYQIQNPLISSLTHHQCTTECRNKSLLQSWARMVIKYLAISAPMPAIFVDNIRFWYTCVYQMHLRRPVPLWRNRGLCYSIFIQIGNW